MTGARGGFFLSSARARELLDALRDDATPHDAASPVVNAIVGTSTQSWEDSARVSIARRGRGDGLLPGAV